jgi:hypothetical protein
MRAHGVLYFPFIFRPLEPIAGSARLILERGDVSENIALSGAMFHPRNRMKQITDATKPDSVPHEELLKRALSIQEATGSDKLNRAEKAQ